MRTRAVLEKGGVAVRFPRHRRAQERLALRRRATCCSTSRRASPSMPRRASRSSRWPTSTTRSRSTRPRLHALPGPPAAARADGALHARLSGRRADGTLTVDTEIGRARRALHGVGFDAGRLEAHLDCGSTSSRARAAPSCASTSCDSSGARARSIARGAWTCGGALRVTLFAEHLGLADLEPLRGTGRRSERRARPGGRGARHTLAARGAARPEPGRHSPRTSAASAMAASSSTSPTATTRGCVRAAKVDADAASQDEPCAQARSAVLYANWSGGPTPAPPPGKASIDSVLVNLKTTSSGAPSRNPPRATLLCGNNAFGGRLDFDLAVGTDPLLPVRGSWAFATYRQSGSCPSRHGKLPVVRPGVRKRHHHRRLGARSRHLVGSVALSSLRFGR